MQQFHFPHPPRDKAAQFFDSGDHDTVWHIGGDFDLADLPRQHEMHHAALRFFVGLQARENLAGTHFEFRETSQTEHSVSDAARGHAIRAPYRECDVGRGNHPPGYRFAVKQASVAGFSLKRVSDGVTED